MTNKHGICNNTEKIVQSNTEDDRGKIIEAFSYSFKIFEVGLFLHFHCMHIFF